MKQTLKNIPFHAFLITPALIFFVFVHNYSSTTFKSTLRSYEIAIGISAIIFGCSYFLLKKNKHKAGVVTTSLVLILFFYGFIYAFAEKLFFRGLWPFNDIHRYLLITIVLLIFVLSYFLFRTKRSFFTLTYSLNIFVLILFIINISKLIFFTSNAELTNKHIEIIPSKKTSDTMPDIYYIILDAYANDSVLSEIYNYRDNSLTSFLKKNDFFIAQNSHTNYISTDPSLSSSLNYSYLDSIDAKSKNIIYDNKVSLYLKRKDYKVVHVRSGFSVSRENYYADKIITLNNLSEFERTLLHLSIFRLDDLLGYVRYKSLKEQLSEMYHVFDIRGPKYVFLHIVSPHPPYICDENGNFKTSKRVINVWWEPKKDYLTQLKYINKEIIKFISEIMKKSKVKPIIIVQSDHGPYIQSKSFLEIYTSRSMILNSYFIPYSWKNKLYSEISPVNSFRFTFNGLFHDSLPLLKDIPLDSAFLKKNINSNLILKE